jgi:cytochrome c551/c552
MCTWREVVAFVLLAAAAMCAWAQAPQRYAGIGRPATPAEVAAWDIDVRPDFKGLPAGSGSVAKGQQLWEAQCASCHGVFGEATEVFNPLVGGTSEDDIRTGRVANLRRKDYPARTTLMKLTSVATLWDYIHRAMPWNKPKSLSVEEVYAATAYMLHLGGIVPQGFVLSDRNIAEVQQRLPNRKGSTTAHALWPGRELRGTPRPDVRAGACMKDCSASAQVTSTLPDHARNAHGNLAEQNRAVGPQRGANTAHPPGGAIQTAAQGAPAPTATMPAELLQKNSCTACHASDRKLVGPSWADVAKKHPGKGDYLAGKIREGGSGAWGSIPMPPQAISTQEAGRIAEWLASGAAP